jgi:hypothetical protein
MSTGLGLSGKTSLPLTFTLPGATSVLYRRLNLEQRFEVGALQMAVLGD